VLVLEAGKTGVRTPSSTPLQPSKGDATPLAAASCSRPTDEWAVNPQLSRIFSHITSIGQKRPSGSILLGPRGKIKADKPKHTYRVTQSKGKKITISGQPAGDLPPGRKCNSCQALLEPVFDQTLSETYQYDNVLWIGFFGGYGMFIDDGDSEQSERNLGGAISQAVICHDCAHVLCDENPWLAEILDPLNSHSHSYKREWGEHIGWDLPH